MVTLERLLEYTFEVLGKPSGGPPSGPVVERYADRVPQFLTRFWREAGLGLVLDGYFQFCDPWRHRSVVEMVFDGDPDIHPQQSHLLGYSAFGTLLLWNEALRDISVDMLYRQIGCRQLFKPTPDVQVDISAMTALTSVKEESFDGIDENGHLMFKRALKAHGPLKYGQIYAPILNPALGGRMVLDNFRPASALEALALAAQAGPFTLYEVHERGIRDVRLIGR